MAQFYRLDKETVIDTVTDISEEEWEIKQILPYELITVDVVDTEDLPDNTFEILEDKVLETRYKHIHIQTLDEYKIQTYRVLATATKDYVMSITPEYKQLSALATLIDPDNASYTLEEATKIRDFAKQHTDEVRRIKPLIFTATTKEEVDEQPTEVKFDWVV